MNVCNQMISGTFHPPSGVLFSFPSRYYSAIGLEKYLALDATFTYIHCPLPRTTTLDIVRSPLLLLTGVSPPSPGHSSPLKLGFEDRNTISHHISTMLPWQIQFGLFPFRSPLLGKSLLISFPRGTQMLHFPRFDLNYHCN